MNQDKLLSLAKETKVCAIHPGYGFLSENPNFVQKVKKGGFIFIGLHSETVEWMGDKIKARTLMKQAGVPVVPGSELVNDVDKACRAADLIGYPIMLKASAGGGGIGLQRYKNEGELRSAFHTNQARAIAFFGDGTMFIEKCIDKGRHIEVQIFGDQQGNVLHLYERDCSIQRRHQKIVKETPSSFLSEYVRSKLTNAEVHAAQFVGYIGA